MTAQAPATLTRAETGELLVILFRYVEANISAHPALLAAVDPLREAAQCYGRNDTAGAADRAIRTYDLLQRTRAANPALPPP